MDHYAGIDVSLESSSVCIVDAQGKIVKEAKVASEPEALIAWFVSQPILPARIGLEAGPFAVALCWPEVCRACGGADRDAPRAGCLQGHAGED